MDQTRKLRARFWLIAAAMVALVAGAFWNAREIPPMSIFLSLIGLVAAIGYFWHMLDHRLLKPLDRLADDLARVARGAGPDAVDPLRDTPIEDIAEAVTELARQRDQRNAT